MTDVRRIRLRSTASPVNVLMSTGFMSGVLTAAPLSLPAGSVFGRAAGVSEAWSSLVNGTKCLYSLVIDLT